MKSVAKEMKVKGKHLFHPVRLALTGEMSGQDVTKQMSLLALASEDDTAVNAEAADVVTIEARMEKLKGFCDSIPEEFRASKQVASDDAANKSKD
eukprot:scaffold12526_cov113-Skeletonema_dohrnii-CCMP3373.AAC.1